MPQYRATGRLEARATMRTASLLEHFLHFAAIYVDCHCKFFLISRSLISIDNDRSIGNYFVLCRDLRCNGYWGGAFTRRIGSVHYLLLSSSFGCIDSISWEGWG
ncbi:hypothetical protein B0H34DRAFT_59231 [Crassisporium funariophilum]|nr:hypothetical protein B0H34DRAFT_59231 [Crassisporium funariophilum]